MLGSLLDVGCEHINVARANVLSVENNLGALCLLLVGEEDKCVTSHLSVRLVKDNVAFCDSEVSEEFTNFLHAC